MSGFCDIAIVGAGPYGLSLAAHLAETGARFRIFGKPLDSWRAHMPAGMLLKSDGFASNLSSPDPQSTLKAYCAAHGHAYDDHLLPVTLSLFNEYSSWFQKRYVPMLEDRQVTALEKTSQGYRLTLDSGETCEAAKVVLAVGITWFAKAPNILGNLPETLVSHSFNNNRLERYAGRAVTVLGAGSSAIDTASLLSEAGADVTLLARSPHLHFHGAPDPDGVSWLRQLTHPSSGIGPGWRSFFCARAPRLFRRLPQNLRLEATRRHLGPAAGWFMRERIQDRVTCLLAAQLTGAMAKDGHVVLKAQHEGREVTLTADHVIAATGYRPDLRRLKFLSNEIRGRLSQVVNTPHLSDNFETSLDGLYVVGPLAANSFGPLMRFMVGAEYAAPRLAHHLLSEQKNTRQALSA